MFPHLISKSDPSSRLIPAVLDENQGIAPSSYGLHPHFRSWGLKDYGSLKESTGYTQYSQLGRLWISAGSILDIRGKI
jgi:hypothetical protein